ncbi:helix-turn-helix domain-containing protein [Streptomyces sp. NBC_00006]|uniref:helix-turn-helix domain-containing protein n=1 Tax=Streptomyces sp. NBC_00006 TaxID=2975619 RepID=UPI0022559186|nr:helix-turn-helix transcriptional regulator [Streptomyces sp. NBC_00006]MCX5537689.1 helix-turn-helix domain-containing protein [Streptomyces sp. NBC_00006]MCX5537900.1 helix-turn-helix domain-containing protein [Streptomyces sp. NBC_00006]
MPAEQPQWILDARRAVGDRIRVRRLHLNMTQETLAHESELDRSTIQRMEAGHEMKLSHLLHIAHALRVHISELLR